jgi:hypothetical protein
LGLRVSYSATCDACQKEEEFLGGKFAYQAPPGWASIDLCLEGKRKLADVYACSKECLLKLLTAAAS